jgi:hypothetical protein
MPVIESRVPTVTSITFEAPVTGSTTVTGTVPGATSSDAGTSAVRLLALPKVVARTLAAKWTFDDGVKLAPPTAERFRSADLEHRGRHDVQDRRRRPDDKRATVGIAAGNGRVAHHDREGPGAASSAAGTSALKRVALMKRVVERRRTEDDAGGRVETQALDRKHQRTGTRDRLVGHEAGQRRLERPGEPAWISRRRGALRAPR